MEKPVLITLMLILFLMTRCSTETKENVIGLDPTVFSIEDLYHYEIEIGFKCNADGSPTEVVRFFKDLVLQKNYKEVALHLNNTNPAYRVLSTLLIEKLIEKSIVSSNPFTDRAILRNKNSWELVYCLLYTSPSPRDTR